MMGNGHRHDFVAYDNDTRPNHFYDTTGLGLVIVRGNNPFFDLQIAGVSFQSHLYIVDAQGGRLVFDRQFRLRRIISAQNPDIIKEIVYDSNGRLISFFDRRHRNTLTNITSRRIEFTYEDNLLRRMTCFQRVGNADKSMHEVAYRYDASNNLTSVSEVSEGDEKERRVAVAYKYGTNNDRWLLTHAIRISSGLAIRFNYEEGANIRISRVDTGFMPNPPPFVSNRTIVGSGLIVGGTNVFNSKNHTSFDYNNVSTARTRTSIRNERNVVIDYFFNEKGFTTGVFERRYPDSTSPDNLMTLTKDGGFRPNFEGSGISGDERLNGAWRITVPRINPNASALQFNANVIQQINNHISRETNEDDTNQTRKYVISFWLRIPSRQGANFRAEIQAGFNNRGNNTTWVSSVLIDNTAVNAWQYVTIPVHLRTQNINANNANNRINLTAMSIALIDTTGVGDIHINNIRITPNQSPEMWIGSSENDNQNVPLLTSHWATVGSIGHKIGDAWHDIGVDTNNFMTESDITATYLNLANTGRSADTSTSQFDMVYCGGTKRRRVSDVRVISRNQSPANPRDVTVVFRVNSTSTDNSANFQFRAVSPDENSYSTTRFWYSLSNVAQRTFTRTRNNEGGDWTERGDEYVTLDHRRGNLIFEQDSYRVRTTYTYDNFGNPTHAATTARNADQSQRVGPTIEHSLTYNGNNESEREFVVSANSNETAVPANRTSKSFSRENPFNRLTRFNTQRRDGEGIGATTHINAGHFNMTTGVSQDATASVTGIDNRNSLSRNSVSYNFQDKIASVSERDNHAFTFGYNTFGDITDYKEEVRNSQGVVQSENTMLSKVYHHQGDVRVVEDFHNNAVNRISTRLDNYNRPTNMTRRPDISVDQVSTVAEFRYQDGDARSGRTPISESPHAAKLTSVRDNLEGRTYEYRYDDENNMCGWFYRNSGDTSNPRILNVVQSTPTRTQYELNRDGTRERAETEIVYDDTPNRGGTNPRISGTRYHVSMNAADSPDFEVRDYCYNYGYDLLGRLDTKNSIAHRISIGPNRYSDVETRNTYRYHAGTNLILDITTRHNNLTRINTHEVIRNGNSNTLSYGYDKRNNVERATERLFFDFPIAPFTSNERTRLFDYDEQDRVTIERFGVGNFTHENIPQTLDLNQRYEYTDGNRVRFIRNNATNAIIRQFDYTNGKLRRRTGETVDRQYDNYGNLISIGLGASAANGRTFDWVRGNLLDTITPGNGSGLSTVHYDYNHQGVCFRRHVQFGTTTNFILDGHKILGENRGTSASMVRLRYIYDATGIIGVRRRIGTGNGDLPGNWENFIYQKDALGNIIGILNQDRELVCRYFYTAFGETSIRNPNGSLGNFANNHIARQNPFRWKSHYQIGTSANSTDGYYMITDESGTRVYDPTICGYIGAERPETLLLNAGVVHGLNRYGITVNNPVALIAALFTIHTTIALSWDRGYTRRFSWWVRNMWWVRWALLAVTIIISLVTLGKAAPSVALAIGLLVVSMTVMGLVIGGFSGPGIGFDWGRAANMVFDNASSMMRVVAIVGVIVIITSIIISVMNAAVMAIKKKMAAIAKKKADAAANMVANVQVKKGTLTGIEYTPEVLEQMANSSDLHHSFPSIIDDIASTHGNVGQFAGSKDGVVRTVVELPGSINGKQGVYQWIIEPNGVTVNHRFFSFFSLL